MYYRAAENIFCESFNARNLSRGDHAIDAEKNSIGIGLKTFLRGNNKTWQKIAEFNAERINYESLSPGAYIRKIAELRNNRLQFVKDAYGVEDLLYHCVVREKDKFSIHEEAMNFVDINNIADIKPNSSTISFNDGMHEYSFLKTKSTLTKRFTTLSPIANLDIRIYDNPLGELSKLFHIETPVEIPEITGTVFLPLYGGGGEVFERSGLNQWNAGGRTRHDDEAYIPVPVEVHRYFPGFFPPRDEHFQLKFPDGTIRESKICQAGGKALMTKSNRELGNWLLRKVLRLQPGELVTRQLLDDLGIDSVRVDKFPDRTYEINFAPTGAYEQFISNYK